MNIPITVITIVKNNEDLLPRAIDSVLAQTFTDFEYILINDGSDDGTREVIDRYVRDDSRLSARHFDACQGRSNARNAGMDLASGAYICFLDSDDYLSEKALEVLHKTAEEHRADIVYGGTRCFDNETGKWLDKHYTDDIVGNERHGFRLQDDLALINNHQIVGRLYRSEMLKRHDIRFSTIRKNGEDVLFAFYTAFYADRISMLPAEKVYIYSLGNFILTANESKLFDARDNVLETIEFSVRSGSPELQAEMWKKGVVFSSDLKRAGKVYEGDDVGMLKYVASLKPLISGSDESTLSRVSDFQRGFCELISSGQYIDAYMLWHESQMMQYKSGQDGGKLGPIRFLSKCLFILRSKLSNKVKSRIRSSWLWRYIVPLRNQLKECTKLWSGYRPSVRAGSGSEIKVSVIIPVYNVDECIRQCLSSVVSQTLGDIEIICVDDCGDDKSSSIIEEYAEENKHFVLLKHEENRGLPAARNTGLDAARGEYIFFLDSDDYLARNDALEMLYSAACKDDADEVIGGVLKWHEHTNDRYLDWHKSYLDKEVHGVQIKSLPQLRCNVVAWNKLIKHSLLVENGIRFNEAIKKHEDNPFSCQVHVLANKSTIIPVTTYMYRQARSTSIMSQVKKVDAHYRYLYCSDIFAFIESDESLYTYREIYYPMYFRQLISGAAILDKFSPTEREKREIMDKWMQAVNVIPEDLPGAPRDLAGVIDLIRQGRFEEGWQKGVELSHV